MKYYAIADLHGRYDLLRDAVNAIEKHSMNDDDTRYITLGDYIDRGPQSRQIIEYLMKQGKNWTCLKGNHEDMMVESITTPLMPAWWIGNGGDATIASYGWGGEPYTSYMYECVPKSHLDWLSNLPIYYETDKQLFVHAGIPDYEMNLPPKNAHKYQDMMWMLYSKGEAGGWKGKHVVHGHHQFADGPHTFHGKHGGRTDLDTWAYNTGRLVVGVFDDTQGHAIDFIEINA